MKPGTHERPPAQKRPAPGRVRAIVLAVLVHAAFIAVIVFGVTWQSAPTAPVQAELWDKLPPAKTAQTDAAKPPPPPEPPRPEPKPEPKPEPPPPEPPKPKAEPPKPDPEIALKAEREKKAREQREKVERDKREKAERDQREKAEKEKAEKKRAEQERKQQAEQMKREEDERVRQIQQAQAEAARARAAAAAARQKEFNEWVDRIRVKIRSRANVPDTVPKGTRVQVLIRILPGGEVLDISMQKRSGNVAYDNAIERAIRSASPLPVPPPNSELFPQFRELSLNFEHEG